MFRKWDWNLGISVDAHSEDQRRRDILPRLGLPAKTLEAASAEIAPIPDALTAR
jgi:hypothetical protein